MKEPRQVRFARTPPVKRWFSSARYGLPRDLRSFPTRRSSDLRTRRLHGPHREPLQHPGQPGAQPESRLPAPARPGAGRRSEEHTSELQSQSNLVCRLLLEKKNYTMKILIDETILDPDVLQIEF